jgi:hypothetical protein
MSGSLDQQLSSLIQARGKQAKTLDAAIGGWQSLGGALRGLSGALAGLAGHPDAPAGLDAVRSQLDALPGRIDVEVVPRLQRVQRRFSRSTLNIGVAGEARVGKSTLLQSLTGLGEDQVPTGDTLPVTAVRSRIFHVPNAARARFQFHTWDSFRREVLGPYWERMGWGAAPATAEAFRRFSLPAVSSTDPNAGTLQGLRERVQGMHASIDSYLPYLSGDSRTLELEAIRPYVAYPKADDVDPSNKAERRYLAVREAYIECEFPGVDVRSIGLVDLPGMGEIVAAGEDRHVSGMSDEVDLVLLVSRPAKKAYWSAEAARALDVVREARCGAEDSDFCVLVINTGDASPKQLADFRLDAERKTGREYSIILADVRDRAGVRGTLMQPVLQRLADRLPVMDEAAIRYAQSEVQALAADVLRVIDAVGAVLTRDVPQSKHSHMVLNHMAKDLHEEIALQLFDLVDELKLRSRGPKAEDAQFEAAVGVCYDELRAWLNDGLGKTTPEWLRYAEKALKRDRDSGRLVGYEFNRIRVHVAAQFSTLDGHLGQKMDELWGRIADIVGPRFGLPVGAPKQRLIELRARLVKAGCQAMAAAVDGLLNTRLDYRTHFHPRLRRQLDVLSAQVRDPETGEERRVIVVPATLDGAEEALRMLAEHGERAAWEAQKAMLVDLELPALVLHAAAEQFEDTILRSGTAEDEFILFALAYRDEIWPGVFEGLDRTHRLFTECEEHLKRAKEAVSGVTGGGR